MQQKYRKNTEKNTPTNSPKMQQKGSNSVEALLWHSVYCEQFCIWCIFRLFFGAFWHCFWCMFAACGAFFWHFWGMICLWHFWWIFDVLLLHFGVFLRHFANISMAFLMYLRCIFETFLELFWMQFSVHFLWNFRCIFDAF